MPERVVVITGASRGIGRALALQLAAAGTHLVLTHRRNPDAAADTLREVESRGGSGSVAVLELEQPESIDALFDEVASRLGRVDGLVANAAASAFKPLERLTVNNLDRNFATNTRSFVLLAQRAAALMGRGGRIVAVTSYGSQRAFANYGDLGAAKAAVEAYVRSMAAEFGGRGITVNAVNGGLIDTDSLRHFYEAVPGMPPLERMLERVPLARAGTADELAAAIVFLLSPSASYITGHTLVVDGGLTTSVSPFLSDLEE